MRIDIGSFVFNCEVSQPGSTPSWGTSLGQGNGYKIKEEYNDIMTAMIYNAIKDKENIDCPLGRGGNGNESGTHDIIIASKFSKVYVNNRFIKDAEFILLIIKEHTKSHDGRLTLKYSKNIKYNNEKYIGRQNINELCIELIVDNLYFAKETSWVVYDIHVKNQDELHLTILTLDYNKSIEYATESERKDKIIDMSNKLKDIKEANESNDKKFEKFISLYVEKPNNYIDALKNNEVIEKVRKIFPEFQHKNFYEEFDINSIERYYNYFLLNDKDEEFQSCFLINNRWLRSALKYYFYLLLVISNEMLETKNGNHNKIIYGIPGVGKSYEIKRYKNDYQQENTIFHPEYTNADFVGQLLPVRNKNEDNTSNNPDNKQSSISYEFVPGPFTRILAKSLKNQNDPDKKYMLVIDEINRGNAAAIFGEIFQLLDRDESGKSEFSISNKDIYDYLIEKEGVDKSLVPDGKIYLPPNLYIWATMNTSDQNVYTLDTAFQRRWQMEMLTIDFEKGETKEHGEIKIPISKDELTWKEFVTAINEEISNRNEGMISVEDKRIGPWFAKKNEIEDKNLFTQKVIKYLWDDAFKMSRTEVFKKVKNLDEIVDKINKGSNIEDIFNQEIFEKVLNNRNVNNKDNQKTEIEDTNE